jgi:calmodulin
MSADDFKLFDKTGKGKIEESDLRDALATLHIEASDEYIKALMAEADANKDGAVDPDEFAKLIARDRELPDVGALVAAFDLLTDGSGQIEVEKLKEFMLNRGNKLSEEEMGLMMKDCLDQTKDGKVDYKAFCALMVTK